jgi:hypothetical protein
MTRRFLAVTTFSAKGFDEYGREMVETFDRHWTRDVPLLVYRDGFDFTPNWRIKCCDLSTISWLRDFKSRHKLNRAARGLTKSGGYDYRFDCVKFAHKTAAIIHAAVMAQALNSADVLIWLDGDTVTHAPVTTDFLDALLPPGKALAWLDRTKLHYPECGWVMYDLKHPAIAGLMSSWRGLYQSDAVLGLAETHDSYVLQHLVNKIGLPWASLSGDARDSFHPAAEGPLAAVIDHRKGARKSLPHSPEHRILAR